MIIKERIAKRQKIRAAINALQTHDKDSSYLLLISESLDDYIEHQIETDKVLEGILKDIQGNIATSTFKQS